MTAPPIIDPRASTGGSEDDALEYLSRMASGNDALVAKPGLFQALIDQKATPQQAQTINSFLGILDAERAVRTAGTTKIKLSDEQQRGLTQMGVNFAPVLYTHQDADADLEAAAKAQGKELVRDPKTGRPETDDAGRPLVRPAQPKKQDGGGGFWSDLWGGIEKVGSFLSNPVGRTEKRAREKQGEKFPDESNFLGRLKATGDALYMPYQFLSTSVSDLAQDIAGTSDAADKVNRQVMERLGYDPDNIFSVIAFRAQGYEQNDLTDLEKQWDQEHPNGDPLLGTGEQAVVEAAAFNANPEAYRKHLAATLSDEDFAARMQVISSKAFQDLAARVRGKKSDIGSNFADGLGIDPVEHPTLSAVTAASTNLLASLFVDPIAFGANVHRANELRSVAVRNFADGDRLREIYQSAPKTGAQANQQRWLREITDDYAPAIRNAANEAEAAAVFARAKSNPYSFLLQDALGESQALRLKSEAELANIKPGENPYPYVVGRGKPIESYDEMVDYLVSKNALLRMSHGVAPVNSAYLPGAVSSPVFKQISGSLAAWKTSRGLGQRADQVSRFQAWRQANPEKFAALLDDEALVRSLPDADDAIEALTGKVLAAKQALDEAVVTQTRLVSEATVAKSAERGALALGKRTGKWNPNYAELQSARAKAENAAAQAKAEVGKASGILASAQRAQRQAEEALNGSVIPGMVRSNMLRYGQPVAPETLLGRGLSAMTLGTVQRGKMAFQRLTTQMPETRMIDLTSGSAVDLVRKVALTYMTPADANLAAARFLRGDYAVRKSVLQGLEQQIGHAAGLSRSESGRALMEKWATQKQAYNTIGREVIGGDGKPVAQWPGQVQTQFLTPNFGEVNRAAAKIGLYEATMGRLMGTWTADFLMRQWRTGVLAIPRTAWRAITEGLIVAKTDNMLTKAIRAKTVMKSNGLLSGAYVGRMRLTDKIATVWGLRHTGEFIRSFLGRNVTAAEKHEIIHLPVDIKNAQLHSQQMEHFLVNVDPSGVDEATQIAMQGLKPVRVSWDTSAAWSNALKRRSGYELTEDLDGARGARLYSHSLGMRVNDAPHVAKAVLARVQDPEVPLDTIVKALESPGSKHLIDQTPFGRVFWDDAGKQQPAITADEIALGKQQWAQNLTDEMAFLVTGRNGNINQKLVDFILEKGKAPNAEWLAEHVTGMARPRALLAPQFDAVISTPGRIGRNFPTLAQARVYADALQDVEGRAYGWLVERLIQRHLTSPLFTAAAVDAKLALNETLKKQLLAGGIGEEAAERATWSMAAQQGWARIARMVDDPTLKMQMDVVGRSFFAFSRATTMMLRRWGDTLWRNPGAAQRLQLTAEATVQSGLIYKNTDGRWEFRFPASGVAQQALAWLGERLPFLPSFQFPKAADFTGDVASIIPGSDNPFQYNTTPLISIGGRELSTFIGNWMPDVKEVFDDIDMKLNGQMGQGRGAWDTLTPTLARQVLAPWTNDDDRNGILASAMISGLYTQIAAGDVPPADASDSEIDAWLARWRSTTQSTLYLRGMLGLVSPAIIGLPSDPSKPDFAYKASGAQNLRDEWRMLLNDMDGDFGRAMVVWTQIHPGEMIYTASGSHATTSKASLPPTEAAFQWMSDNKQFINKYKSVAAFFIPPQEKGQPYSQRAYRAQLELGLRERKTPKEFYEDARVSSAANVYYAESDKFKAEYARLRAIGNNELASQHRQAWLQWSAEFKEQNPLFKARLAGSATNAQLANRQLDDLRQMAKDGAVPGGQQANAAVASMVAAYDGYRDFMRQHPGSTNVEKAAKQQAFALLQNHLSAVVDAVPEVAGVYRGVFQVLNNKLEDANGGAE